MIFIGSRRECPSRQLPETANNTFTFFPLTTHFFTFQMSKSSLCVSALPPQQPKEVGIDARIAAQPKEVGIDARIAALSQKAAELEKHHCELEKQQELVKHEMDELLREKELNRAWTLIVVCKSQTTKVRVFLVNTTLVRVYFKAIAKDAFIKLVPAPTKDGYEPVDYTLVDPQGAHVRACSGVRPTWTFEQPASMEKWYGGRLVVASDLWMHYDQSLLTFAVYPTQSEIDSERFKPQS